MTRDDQQGGGAMNACEKRVLQVKGWSLNSGKGAYLRMLRGESITRGAAIKAKCAECCAGYADGRADCQVPLCPLYPYMPYTARTAAVLDDEGDGADRLPSPDEIAAQNGTRPPGGDPGAPS